MSCFFGGLGLRTRKDIYEKVKDPKPNTKKKDPKPNPNTKKKDPIDLASNQVFHIFHIFHIKHFLFRSWFEAKKKCKIQNQTQIPKRKTPSTLKTKGATNQDKPPRQSTRPDKGQAGNQRPTKTKTPSSKKTLQRPKPYFWRIGVIPIKGYIF
jgi:hypothetical protein